MALRGPSVGARWGRWTRRHRRVLAGLATGASVLALGIALQPPPTGTVEVVVAARDLSVGTRLAAEDLTTAAVPAAVIPPGTGADPTTLVGQVVGATMIRGEAISRARLVAPPGGAWAAPAGTSVLPVRFSDAEAAALLVAGQRVDVLAASAVGADAFGTVASAPIARIVAEDVLVLAVASQPLDEAGFLGSGSAGQDEASLVVLAATRAEALGIAGAEAGSRLSFTLAPTGSGT